MKVDGGLYFKKVLEDWKLLKQWEKLKWSRDNGDMAYRGRKRRNHGYHKEEAVTDGNFKYNV